MALPLAAYAATRNRRSAPSMPFGWGAVTVLGVGAVLLVAGILIIVYGMFSFITGILNNALSSNFSVTGFFGGFFGAIMLFVLGGVLAGVGGWMVRLWWLFLLFGAVAGSGASADTVRGREEMSASAGNVKVRCRACGRLNPEEAKFCIACGQPV
jgi:zinc ribbon protein